MQELTNLLKKNNELLNCVLLSNIIINSDINKDDKQILLYLLQDRDRNYIRLNDNYLVVENIKKYLNYLRAYKLKTQDLIRVGGNSDGGYVMLNFANGGGGISKNTKAISLGVSDYSPWDLEMAQAGFEVIAYDGSIAQHPHPHKNIKFINKFIGNNCDEVSLQEAILENKLDSSLKNILQMDIENCEWQVLENTDLSLIEKYFSQVIFEFHGMNPEEMQGASLRFKQLQRINEYFVPIHLHFNNHGKIFYSNGVFFSTTIEVSYLRKKDYEIYLQENKLQQEQKKDGILSGLDYATFLANPEIPVRYI